MSRKHRRPPSASFAYFVARYLGYRAKMYDGSFIEWSKTPETEVVTGR